MRGKRSMDEDDEEFDWDLVPVKKIVIGVSIVIAVILLTIFVVYMINRRRAADEANRPTENVVQEDVAETLPKEYKGYPVLGQLVIDKLELKEYILDSKEDDAMEKAPVKLYGEVLNDEGNFCIAGHNYDEVFASLEDLEEGDTFYIVDMVDTIQDYVIKEIKEVEPTDLSVLMPVEDKIQVTLITCQEGATKRLVIVAERIDVEG